MPLFHFSLTDFVVWMFKMFGSTLFRVMYTKYTILLRRANLQTKKGNVGEVIKKLNKENKSLFGELLETRPQKRKREAREGPQISSSSEQQLDCVQNQTSSEAWWYRQTPPASHVVQMKRNSNTDSEVKSNESDTPRDQSLKTSRKRHNVNFFVKSESQASNYHHTSLLSLKNNENGASSNSAGNLCTGHVTNVEETDKKSTVLELPEIIVRNIPTFPLINECKNTELMIPTESILNTSSNTEQVHNKDYLLYPSVTKILNATMSDSSRAALKKWRQKMIDLLGEEGFVNYHRGLLDRGIQFHAVIHDYLSGIPEVDLKLDHVEGCWQSLENVMTDITDVRVLESHVVHSSLLYRGVIDCVAKYKGKPVLIEWKKSDKQKAEIEKTYDAPLQLSAYLGAMNYDVKYNFQVLRGLVVVAYNDGSPANTFIMSLTDCKKYWSFWLLRLQQYWLQQQKGIMQST